MLLHNDDGRSNSTARCAVVRYARETKRKVLAGRITKSKSNWRWLEKPMRKKQNHFFSNSSGQNWEKKKRAEY